MGLDSLKLTIDLVPRSLWGRSLAQLLPRSAWDRLRADVLRSNGAICEVCGSRWPLECDEVWTYDNVARVAHLSRLRIICRLCHRAKHFGRTRSVAEDDEMEAVIAHFCRVNGCDHAIFEAHEDQAFDLWLERNRLGTWAVDFGAYGHLLPIEE